MTTCGRIVKDMTISFSALLRKKSKKNLTSYKEEALVKQGREQFKKLIEKGMELPVVLL